MRVRPVGPNGLPISDPNCRRCDGEAEKPNLLCTGCKDHYRSQYGMLKMGKIVFPSNN